MIIRLGFYMAEALFLACLFSLALLAATRGCARLGWAMKPRWPRVYGLTWTVVFIVGVAGGELLGPEFLLVYAVAGYMLALGVALWIGAVPLAKYMRITPNPQ
jgi:hypothetical protein